MKNACLCCTSVSLGGRDDPTISESPYIVRYQDSEYQRIKEIQNNEEMELKSNRVHILLPECDQEYDSSHYS